MKRLPKVGIVISSYMRQDFLKQAVESSVNQTYKNTAILVMDDHSPDGSVRSFLESLRVPNLKYSINRKNLGVTRNYDKGIRLLPKDVEWCLILDNDDFLDKNCITEAVKIHLKYPVAQVIHCGQVFVTDHDKTSYSDIDYSPIETAEDYMRQRAYNKREIRSSAVFFSRHQFFQIGGYPKFETGLGTDAVFIFALAYGNSLAYAKKARVYTRLHALAESQSLSDLFPKFKSIQQMHDYVQWILSPAADHDSSQTRIMQAVTYYQKRLNLVLLTGKLRDLLLNKSLVQVPAEYKQVLLRCHKIGTDFSASSLLLAWIYAIVSWVLESLGASDAFMFRIQRFGSRLTPGWLR